MYLLAELIRNASFLGHALEILINSISSEILFKFSNLVFARAITREKSNRKRIARKRTLRYLALVFLMKVYQCFAACRR
jgi:hypothetical protein